MDIQTLDELVTVSFPKSVKFRQTQDILRYICERTGYELTYTKETHLLIRQGASSRKAVVSAAEIGGRFSKNWEISFVAEQEDIAMIRFSGLRFWTTPGRTASDEYWNQERREMLTRVRTAVNDYFASAGGEEKKS